MGLELGPWLLGTGLLHDPNFQGPRETRLVLNTAGGMRKTQAPHLGGQSFPPVSTVHLLELL